MKHRVQIAVIVLALLSALVPPDSAHAARKKRAAASEADITKAVERGITYVKTRQRKDGSWDGGGHDAGVTALAVYALINAKCPPADPAVASGVQSILKTSVPTDPKHATTYSLSMTALALSAAIEQATGKQRAQATGLNVADCRARLKEITRILVAAQHRCEAGVGIVRRDGH